MYEERWNFPHCLGATDGKHIAIGPPANSGSYCFNYNGHYSFVLMAIVNAKYQFMYIDVGMNGRHSDGGVLQNTVFFEKLENEELNIPSSETLSNKQKFAICICGRRCVSITSRHDKIVSEGQFNIARKKNPELQIISCQAHYRKRFWDNGISISDILY